VIDKEIILDNREYHTIQEVKNGLGPAPIKTPKGLAAPGAWCAQHGGRPALCALSVSCAI
jgi:hypothetical protein